MITVVTPTRRDNDHWCGAHRDDKLSVDEFGALCRALFRTAAGDPYPLETKKLAQMFFVFDKNEVHSHA